MRYIKSGIRRFLLCHMLVCLFALTRGMAREQEPSLETLAKAGHWKRVRQSVQQHPSSSWSEAEKSYWEARVKQAFGDLDGAEALARKAVALEGSNATYHQQLASVALDQLGNQRSMFKALSLSREVRSELQTALGLDPKNVEVMRALMEYLWEAPSMGGGDRQKARQLASQLEQLDRLEGYLAEAQLSEPNGEGNLKAEAALKRATEEFPRDYGARCEFADFYSTRANDYARAEEQANIAATLAPDRARAYAALSAIYVHQGKWDQLDEMLRQAEKAVPDDLNPSFQAGRNMVLTGKGDSDRAETYLRRYLTQEPEGREPQWAAAHWRLGLVFEKKGLKQKAVEELETAVRLQPGLSGARKDLERLR
jgi:tetratricopeptide (TPR) repeat protein